MTLRRFSTSNITTGSKSSKLWDGETFPGYFESISTVVVGSAGSATITFSNIPQNYTQLQVRWTAQSNRPTYTVDNIYLDRINGSTSSNTATHRLFSQTASPGTASIVEGFINYDGVYIGLLSTSVLTNGFGSGIVDILDYTNTNKNKTFRAIGGNDTNGFTAGFAGGITLNSGFINSTSAITSFRIRPEYGTAFTQYSHFALYGIRGA